MFKLCVIILVSIFNILKAELVYQLIGGVTDTTINMKAKTTDAAPLTVYLNDASVGTYSSDSDGYYSVSLNNLAPSTLYRIDIALAGVKVNRTLSVTTFSSQNLTTTGNLTFVVGANMKYNTKSTVYNRMKSLNPNFFMLLGDLHDKQVQSTNFKDQETVIMDTLRNNFTLNLLQTTPLIYFFNEFDFQGEGGSDSSSQYIGTINNAYRKIFPSYGVPSNGIYQSFKANGVLFIMTDSRTFLNRTSGTLFGSTQLQWLNDTLINGYNDPSVTAIVFTITQVWNYYAPAYSSDMIKQDFYSVLDNMQGDKSAIANTTKRFNFGDPSAANYKPIMIVAGEKALSLDNGNFNNYGNFPVVVCGPLDNWSQCRGGPYSHGSFHDSTSQYCIFNVYRNTSNSNACLAVRGIINGDDKNNDTTVFTYDTCNPTLYPARINLKCPILWTEKILNGFITIAVTIFIYVVFYILIYRMALKSLRFQKLKDA